MRISAAEHDLIERCSALMYPIESLDHSEHRRLGWRLLAERPLLMQGTCTGVC